ncbi:EndoU domain-containing protein [Thalassospira sp. TSL5-1]|uniref:EndoU domain-containing protein n=1 Tax=Thalassospira sp. TSL5-1 TaxID=1544451 RepID=UPI000939C7C8|nr:EndoU domain-containing protein [Thalassospira sp. TSL5-1]
MFDRLMLRRAVRGFLVIAAVCLSGTLAAQSGEVLPQPVVCPGQGHGTEAIPINLEHIFCGEINRKNRFTGFHARPQGRNPATIARVVVEAGSENANGIYEATVYWNMDRDGDARPANASKFSTLFPDDCSRDQIIASILYASRHALPSCPAGAPGWTQCGLNRPDGQGDSNGAETAKAHQYCVGKDPSSRFTIAFAPHNGRLNTAFPLMDEK